MHEMTPDEYRHFMLDRARTAKVATASVDGKPHIAPVWFDMDGDVLVFTTWYTTMKAKHIHRDPRISLCVDDDTPPFSFVVVEGTAQIASPTPEEFLHWATRIAGRYMGPTLAESYGKRNAVPGELLIRVTPTKIITRAGMSD
jgi:PPOX class probable F420-dependent enzyme